MSFKTREKVKIMYYDLCFPLPKLNNKPINLCDFSCILKEKKSNANVTS